MTHGPLSDPSGAKAPARPWERGNAWTSVCAAALFPLTRLLGRRRYAGVQNLAVRGPALVVANHISHLDPVFDVVMVRKGGRLPHVMAKASLWRLPIVRRALDGTGQIPVERGGGAGQKALDAAKQALKDGHVVVIYPEGTVTKDPERWPMKPRPGVAALALSGDFPVIPVAHWGTQHVYDSYSSGRKFTPWPRTDVHVVAGTPIDLSEWRGKPVDNRAIRDVSYAVMGRVREMVAALRDEPAPETFFDPKKAARRAAGEGGAATP